MVLVLNRGGVHGSSENEGSLEEMLLMNLVYSAGDLALVGNVNLVGEFGGSGKAIFSLAISLSLSLLCVLEVAK